MMFKPSGNILYQKEEATNVGCCFSRDQVSKTPYFLKIPSRIRVYSEGRQSKSKKLDVTIAKKSSSQTKQTHHSANTSLQRRKNLVTNRSKQRQSSSQKQPTNRYLKTMNQFDNSKSPKTYINNLLKYPIHPQRHQNIKNVSIKPISQFQAHSSKQLLVIPDISHIMKVEQQFVSQSSATLTILNTISNTQRIQRPQRQRQFNEYSFNTARNHVIPIPSIQMQGYLPSQKLISSPLERMDRKRYEQKIQKIKKKLVN